MITAADNILNISELLSFRNANMHAVNVTMMAIIILAVEYTSLFTGNPCLANPLVTLPVCVPSIYLL